MNLNLTRTTHPVLVIDDNVAIHEDFRKIFAAHAGDERLDAAETALFGDSAAPLEQPRFVIDSAFQGQDGVARAGAARGDGRPYAMAFVDVRMPPGWDGIETISELWKVDPELQVVICTAYSDYSWEAMAGRVGASDQLVFLKKPFDTVEVVQLAHALTARWQLARETRRQIDRLEGLVSSRTEELQRSESHFRAVAQNVGDLVALLDARGARVYHNPAYERALGVPPEELTRMPQAAYIHPDDQIKVLLATQQGMETGRAQTLIYRMRHRDGSWHTLKAQAEPVRDARGQVENIVLIARDITPTRELEF